MKTPRRNTRASGLVFENNFLRFQFVNVPQQEMVEESTILLYDLAVPDNMTKLKTPLVAKNQSSSTGCTAPTPAPQAAPTRANQATPTGTTTSILQDGDKDTPAALAERARELLEALSKGHQIRGCSFLNAIVPLFMNYTATSRPDVISPNNRQFKTVAAVLVPSNGDLGQ